MSDEYTPPPRATGHCRYYSYKHGDLMSDWGPKCALDVDLSDPGASRACWPNPEDECLLRAEYTDEERAAWRTWTAESMDRLSRAVDALPSPLSLNTRGYIACPNCGGDLHYGRWHLGAFVECATKHCCGVRLNIAAGADWPARKGVTPNGDLKDWPERGDPNCESCMGDGMQADGETPCPCVGFYDLPDSTETQPGQGVK